MSSLVVVIGDALLDIDVTGTSQRLCPDAPAPVVDVTQETLRPGGAALAAALAAADGHDVVLISAFGPDPDGDRLRRLLEPRMRVVAVGTDGSTSVKRRVRIDGRTLLRLDTGSPGRLEDTLPPEVAEVLAEADAVLVSDYGRGLTSHPDLRALLSAVANRVPVVWDPHPRGAQPVPGARAVTPNAVEAAGFLDQQALPGPADDLVLAGRRAAALVTGWSAASVVVTLGAKGVLLSYGSGAPTLVPAARVTGGDTCGAGDRFASRLTTLLAEGLVTLEAVSGATAAATEFVAAGGASAFASEPPGPHEPVHGADAVVARVRAAGGTVVATGGCFDLLHAGHVASLAAARELGDCLVVCLNSDASVRRLKGPPRPLVPVADRVRVLEALSCVDAVIVFDEDSPEEVMDRLRPDLWAKGGDYAGAELPEEAVLRRWGGQAVVLPYVSGRSTTGLVRAMSELSTLPEPSAVPREEAS